MTRKQIEGLAIVHRTARIHAGLCAANERRMAPMGSPFKSYSERTTAPVLRTHEKALTAILFAGFAYVMFLVLH